MLTRIYGTAFATKDELAEHLERLEQARARDHRKLGKELELFMFSELSPGSPFWFPNGMAIWNELTDLWRKENADRGYREVHTPILYSSELFKQSGHWHVYGENMYFTDVEGDQMGLKPMNCPAHTQLYKSQRRSYRDLPIRYSEQGLVHRHEPSGTLHGLLRVRHITQDDAHIFATEEQIEEEVIRCLDFGFAIYDRFGFEPRLELSTRPEKRIGSEDMWDRAEAALQRALENHNLDVRAQRGRRRVLRPEDRPPHDRRDRPLVAARHRPARLRDAGALRPHLHRRRQRRAPAGDDPPRADGLLRALHRHARSSTTRASSRSGSRRSRRSCCRSRTATSTTRAQVRAELADFRVEVDERTESIGRKIREAELRKIPYMLVVGDREVEQHTAAVRRHREGDQGALSLDEVAREARRGVTRGHPCPAGDPLGLSVRASACRPPRQEEQPGESVAAPQS